MGKVKIKRKSTLIDMTAMSDVTVLLLTFFMLTSTFLQKEPATVITPSSVSEIKVPTANLVTILVSGAGVKDGKRDTSVEGKVFISIAGDVDSTYSSENVREAVLLEAVNNYNKLHNCNGGACRKGIGKCPGMKKDIPSWFFDRTKKHFSERKELLQKQSKVRRSPLP